MKASSVLLSVIALGLAGSVLAGEGEVYPFPADSAVSPGKTRAEVIAEMQEAQRLGQLGRGEADYPVVATEQSSKSRAAVIAELREAQRLGLVVDREGDVRIPTAEETRLVAEAGRRAAEPVVIAGEGR